MRLVSPTEPLLCFACGKALTPVYPEGWSQPMDAVVFNGYAAYGSDFDGDALMINVCDECIVAHRERVLATEASREPQPMNYFTI